MFGSNVTSSWANPQQNQQQQQPTTGAFGQPSGFGTSGTGAFGQNQPQQQQPQSNPMFGNLGGTTNANPTTTGFGAFGSTNTSQSGATNPMFGAAKPTTGFGAFGGGGGGAFGGGGGAFGQSTNTASGSGTTGLFGQPAATNAPSAFGGGTGLFGGNKPATGFGTTAAPGGAQGSVPAVTAGSTNPPYSVHTEKDGANSNVTLQYQAISCMPAYANTSHEEIRLQDYTQGRKTAGSFGSGAFGSTQPASTGLFGAPAQQPQQQSAFGTTTTNPGGFGAFGSTAANTNTAAPASTGVFGGGGAFGQTQPQQQQPQQTQGFGAFGAPQQPQQQQQTGGLFGGGGGAFGSNAAKPAFSGFGGGTGTSAFGGGAFGQQSQQQNQPQQTQQPAGGLFGSTTTAPATTGFGTFGGTANKSIFGATQPSTTQPTTGFGGFGSNQQQQTQQPQTQQPSLFGGGTGLFGNTQQQQQGTQQPATNPLFGGGQTGGAGLFGGGGGGLFGNNQQQQQQPQQTQQPAQTGAFGGGGLFGAPKPAPTGNLFGGGFGQPSTTTAQQPSLFNPMGQSNNQSTLGGGLFGANKPAPMGTSTSTGGLFGSTNQTGGLFGASANAPGAQGSLTASISQPIGADLPIFDMLPPGPRLVNLESSQQKKKAGFFVDIPTRSPVPRLGYTPANSRLRGFAASTSTAAPAGTNPFAASLSLASSRSNQLSLSRVADNKVPGTDPFGLGRSSSPALGSGARQSVKKVILDKKVEPSELFNKSGGSPGLHGGKVVFSPKLSVASRERDALSAQNQTSGQLESPTPAARPQRTPNRFTAHSTQQPPGEEGGGAAELEEGDYWMKPDLETLKQTGYDELSSFEGLIVGRIGYGEIHFLEPVDLTGLPKLGALIGEVIRFEEKECAVYPDSDEVDKPPPGSGLNVAARITLLGCWAVDKSTREPIKDEKHPSTIKHLKRLKKIPNTHFESFDIATGEWTFRVDHF